MPIRIFNSDGSGITPNRLADAINFARQNGAHVISNSWGYNSDNPNLYPVIKDAIALATTQGRNNLGCVVTFSAGNNLANNGFVHFPSNVDVSGVLTVGASDRFDFKAYYSPLGNPQSTNNQLIDIVAPSHRAYSVQIAGETYEAWSIDIPNDAGYNIVHETDGGNLPVIGSILPNGGTNYLSYTGRFGGTSYSCPQVSGVAALLLSINPNLTQQQVFDILTTTADQVGGYVYTNGRSNELGYGRLNACQAVTEGLSTIATLSGPSTVCSSGATFTVNVPNGCIISWEKSSNLSYSSQVGNPMTFTTNGNGTGWIRATINLSNCGSFVLPAKNVWVGSVLPLNLRLTEKFTGVPVYSFCNGQAKPVKAIHMAGNAYIDRWEWRITNGYVTYDNPYGDNSEVTLRPTSTNFIVEVRAHNSCGWTSWSNLGVYVISCKSMAITIFPNPGVDEATIKLINADKSEIEEIPEWEVKVFNSSQILTTKSQKLKTSSYKLITQGWEDGVYLVQVLINNEQITEKLIIKH